MPMKTSWADTWEQYIRGNVVTDHARRVITNFLRATLARTAAHDESEVEEEGAATVAQDEVKPLCPSLDELRDIIRSNELRIA